MQLLNLFAYGTYPDYIGELVKILQRLFLINVALSGYVAFTRVTEVWDIYNMGWELPNLAVSHFTVLCS